MSNSTKLVVECIETYVHNLVANEVPGLSLDTERPVRTIMQFGSHSDEVARILRDPLCYTLRARAREIGTEAYKQGGRNALYALRDKVKSVCSHDYVLDSWWNGIAKPPF